MDSLAADIPYTPEQTQLLALVMNPPRAQLAATLAPIQADLAAAKADLAAAQAELAALRQAIPVARDSMRAAIAEHETRLAAAAAAASQRPRVGVGVALVLLLPPGVPPPSLETPPSDARRSPPRAASPESPPAGPRAQECALLEPPPAAAAAASPATSPRAPLRAYVLLGQRRGAHGAGSWAFPGGHLEHGEEWGACAARELAEETGLALPPHRFSAGGVVNDVMRGPPQLHYVTLLQTARLSAEEAARPRNCEPHKCGGWEWVPLSEGGARAEALGSGRPLFSSLARWVEEGGLTSAVGRFHAEAEAEVMKG